MLVLDHMAPENCSELISTPSNDIYFTNNVWVMLYRKCAKPETVGCSFKLHTVHIACITLMVCVISRE